MGDYLELGPTPVDEPCCQTGIQDSTLNLFITAGVAVGAAVPSDEVDAIYAVLLDKAKSELSRLQSRGTA